MENYNKKKNRDMNLYFVQGSVKDNGNGNESKGIGESIVINFRAPIDDSSPEEAIKLICYDIGVFDSDWELLRRREFFKYAER